ncbi:MAG: hypothetical protein M5U28_45685 [Sandaracinaceae bacterium]|nr:hypothetical protein [Sandaracinaceae bacterium]
MHTHTRHRPVIARDGAEGTRCARSGCMLPPYIIEELRRRERARSEESARRQPVVELPLAPPPRREPKRDEPERGVTIIDVL